MNAVNPINYKIRLEPDLKNFKFTGLTEILMEADNPVREISLNMLDLTVGSCKANVGGEFMDCPFLLDPKKEEIKIILQEYMSGQIKLKIDYVGEINTRMAGFYRSKYYAGEEEKYIAVTQFEESDARRAFPCFDHPGKKASFDIEMIIDDYLSAISNGPIMKEEAMGDGKKLVKFQQTPRMSTYLLFFGVGEFEFIEDKGDVLVRAVTLPGMTKHSEFGLQFGKKCLEFSEDYYGVKYPLPKLDLIAISDFAAGAMENWGAITFRENLLLYYPNITSKAGEERICEVIAHEIAHQWFGNLVSPSDWKYLWLNESFATYFGYGIVGYYHPEWDMWDQFLHGQTGIALNRDSLHETFPIEIPGGEHVVINASTAPIIYNKGGSVLRQIEGYVGTENFKEGLRRYLKKHAYACASSHHLWEALEEVSDQPISKIMKSWIEQPGFPIVEVKRDGNKLNFYQRRFTHLPNELNQRWLIPINIRVFLNGGDSKILTVLLDNKSMAVDIGSDVHSYKVNHEQTGFYRVKYLEKSNLQELGKQIVQKKMSPEDRWGLQNDLYALVKSCDVPLDDYLDFISFYNDEGAYLPIVSISDNLFHAYLVMEQGRKEKIASVGKSLFEKVLSEISYEPRKGEKHTTSLLRDQIIWQAVLYGSENVSQFAKAGFTSLMKGAKIHPDIMKSVMQVGALGGGSETFEWFENRIQSSKSEHERMNILIAFGSFKEKKCIERAQKYALEEVPDRNKFIPMGQMAINPYAMPDMWGWYVSHLDELEQLHPIHYERVIAAIVPFCSKGKEKQIIEFFESYTRKNEKAKDVIRLSLEKMEINSRMRKS